jgi:prefoldin subunit 5
MAPEPSKSKASFRKISPSLGLLSHCCVRLPGWAALITGVIQFVILVIGTAIGSSGAYLSAADDYRSEEADLAKKKQDAREEQAQLASAMQQVTNQMQQVTNQMQQVINLYKLHVEMPAPRLPLRPEPSRQPAAPLEPMAQYYLLKAQYDKYDQELEKLKDHYDQSESTLRSLQTTVISRPSVFTGLRSSLERSARISNGFLLLNAWSAWISGAVLMTAGACWLAFINLCLKIKHRLDTLDPH